MWWRESLMTAFLMQGLFFFFQAEDGIRDLTVTGVQTCALPISFNGRLIPLIAHDRAGFGGALISVGVAMFLAVLYGRPSRNLWQALALAGLFGFATAIGVHPVIGYTDPFHLGPAILGCVVFAIGLWSAAAMPPLSRCDRKRGRGRPPPRFPSPEPWRHLS